MTTKKYKHSNPFCYSYVIIQGTVFDVTFPAIHSQNPMCWISLHQLHCFQLLVWCFFFLEGVSQLLRYSVLLQLASWWISNLMVFTRPYYITKLSQLLTLLYIANIFRCSMFNYSKEKMFQTEDTLCMIWGQNYLS